MTDRVQKALDAAESLKYILDKTRMYGQLWKCAGRIVLMILTTVSLLLAVLFFIDNYDFNNIVTELGSIRISQGNYLFLFNDIEFATGVALFLIVYRMNISIRNKLEIRETKVFEKKDIKEVVKFIISQDWGHILESITDGKNSFSFYTTMVIFVYAFMIYLLLSLVFPVLIASSGIFTHGYLLDTQLIKVSLSVILAFLTKFRVIRDSIDEINNMKETMKQLRWFAERFEESDFQA